MTGVHRSLFVIGIMIFGAVSLGQDDGASLLIAAEAMMDRGAELLEAGQPETAEAFAEAAVRYETVIRQHGAENPDVFRALGTAWHRAGNPGPAVAALLRAEQLDPLDESTRATLVVARAGLEVRPPGELSGWFRRAALAWRGRISRTWLLGAAAGLWGLGWVVLAARAVGLRSPGWVGLVLIAGATLPGGLLATESAASGFDRMVVLSGETLPRSGPSESVYEPVLAEPLSAGVSGRMVHLRDGWVEVDFGGGQLGWVPENTLIRVSRYLRD